MSNIVQQVNWFFAKVILGIRADREFVLPISTGDWLIDIHRTPASG